METEDARVSVHANTQGVTMAAGFRAGGVSAGIKSTGALDLALVVNDGPSFAAAGVVTRNQIKAAPVVWTQDSLATGRLRAVLLNSGCANACTGPAGLRDAQSEAEVVAQELSAHGSPTVAIDVAVCSTGLIGSRLPTSRILSSIPRLVVQATCGHSSDQQAASAIMTTDSVIKQAALRHTDGWSVGGMAKGAGMLAPSLATMLCVITTDAASSPTALHSALHRATTKTFDRLDVDGSCSTNDTVLLLSSGASGVTPTQDELDAVVMTVCQDLCAQMQADAEGATKRITVIVEGAQTEEDALIAARAIARDNLVKSALFGSDPNWGRVLAAVGAAPVPLDPGRISVSLNGLEVCANSMGMPEARSADMSATDITVLVNLGVGDGTASIRTTDLSLAYVAANSAYSS